MNREEAAGKSEKSRLSAEEARLVARLRDGDEGALAEIFDRYSGMLLGLAQRILGDASDAEEVVQEVFLQVWRQASRYDDRRSALSTWLVLLTRSRSIDRLRSRQVANRTVTAAGREDPSRHTSPRGVRDVLTEERRRRLITELGKLPAEQKRVLELAFFDGLTQREIATETETPLGTVKTRTLLAMKKLRGALAREIGELL